MSQARVHSRRSFMAAPPIQRRIFHGVLEMFLNEGSCDEFATILFLDHFPYVCALLRFDRFQVSP